MMTLKDIVKKYKNRILAILSELKDLLEKAGFHEVDGPDEDDGDEYQWSLFVGDKDTNGASVSLGIVESDERKNSINFRLAAIGWGGEIIAEVAPYNYTKQCWVSLKDWQAIQVRFECLEEIFLPDIVLAIVKHLKGHAFVQCATCGNKISLAGEIGVGNLKVMAAPHHLTIVGEDGFALPSKGPTEKNHCAGSEMLAQIDRMVEEPETDAERCAWKKQSNQHSKAVFVAHRAICAGVDRLLRKNKADNVEVLEVHIQNGKAVCKCVYCKHPNKE